MKSLDAFAEKKIARMVAANEKRTLEPQLRSGGVWVTRGERRLLSFSCNDTLGLSADARVRAAAKAAIDEEGTGAGASRLVTGNPPSLGRLETEMSAFRATEAALVFGSGSLANLGIIPALLGADDLVILDEKAHSCLASGARLSRAKVEFTRHNDVDHVAEVLKAHRKNPGRGRSAPTSRILVAVEGVYSMDGDLAPLPELVSACDAQDAWLLVDDAHAIGTLGDGRGSRAHFNLPPDAIPLQVATLSKALGSYGGVLNANAVVCDLLTSRARTFVYSTGLPPPAAAAASAALEIVANAPELCARPLEHAKHFAARLGLPPPDAHLVPIILGQTDVAVAAQRALAGAGFLVAAIRPPTVAPGTARLRVSFSAAHTRAHVDALADELQRVLVSDVMVPIVPPRTSARP